MTAQHELVPRKIVRCAETAASNCLQSMETALFTGTTCVVMCDEVLVMGQKALCRKSAILKPTNQHCTSSVLSFASMGWMIQIASPILVVETLS